MELSSLERPYRMYGGKMLSYGPLICVNISIRSNQGEEDVDGISRFSYRMKSWIFEKIQV